MSRRYTIVPLLVALAILASSALCQAWLEPRVVGSLGDRAIQRVAVQGSYAYCATSGGMLVFDVSDPTDPTIVGSCDADGWAGDVAVSGSYAYLGAQELSVIDISDPTDPRQVAAITDDGASTGGIELSGDYAYLARDVAGLTITDISNPFAPEDLAILPQEDLGRARDVAVSGDYAYVAGTDGLKVIDVSDPAAPTIVGNLPAGPAPSVAVSGRYLFGGNYSGELVVVDVLDPGAPVQVGSCATARTVVQIALSGDYAYAATEGGGLRIFDISDPSNPTEVASWDPLESVRGVTVVGDRAYVAAGGLHVLDISDPTDPVEMGSCDTGEGAWEVALSGGYAYLLPQDGPLRAVDVSNPAAPVEAGACDIPAGICANEIAISGPYAYVSAAWGGLRIFDISDPQAPVEAGAWTGACIRSLDVSGSYAYTYASPNLHVIDISDPQAPIEAGSCAIGGSYSLNMVISGSYAYVATSDAGMQVIDISDPTDPTPVASVAGCGGAVAVSGDYAYFADGDAGLRVIDISDPTTPTVVGTWVNGMFGGWDEIAIAGDRAYVTTHKLLLVLDISDPTAPVEVGQYHAVGGVSDVAASGDYVYLADGYEGLVILEFLPVQYGPTPVDIEGKMLVSGATNYFIEGSSDNIAPTAVAGRLSPHGDQVIYHEGSLDRDQWLNSRFDILKANSDGTGVADNLSDMAGLGGVNCGADWSPDGNQIAFQHCDPVDGERPCNTGFHVWIMNADGSGAHRLTPEGSVSTSWPYWAPDGSRILCLMDDENRVTIATDGTDFQVLGGRLLASDWSPDGSKIASCRYDYRSVGHEWGYRLGLQLCDADGSNPQTLFERFLSTSMMEQHLIEYGEPAEGPAAINDAVWWIGPQSCQWSPSGDRIAFTGAPHFDPAGPIYYEQVEVWVYELATGTFTNITSMATYWWEVSWIGPNTSPDDPEVTVGDTTVDFGEVTEGGTTTIVWEDDPPEPPMDYQLVGGAYVASTTAEVSDTISICMGYREEDLPTEPAPAGLATAEYDGQLSASAIEEDVLLLLLKYNEDADYWEDITTFVDTENNLICGETDSLGTFGICLAPRRTWFPDVPAYGYGLGGTDPHWAYDAVRACVAAGIVFGYDDGLYRPELKVTRSAMAVYIARALAGGQENVPAGPEEPTFPDVPSSHWAYSSVEYAAANNVVEGYPGGSYQPTWQVTRAQMAVFIARSIVTPTGEVGLEPYEAPETPTFLDVPAGYWTYKHVEYLVEQAIVAGYPDYFGPDLNAYLPLTVVTRDQMAVYIKRAFELPT